jgi:hypothetical protein
MIKKILKTFLASDLIGDLHGEILGRIWEKGRKDSGGISGFSGAGAISGTAVVARRAVRRDRGWPGILGVMADRGVVRDWRCRRNTRHARRGKERGKR